VLADEDDEEGGGGLEVEEVTAAAVKELDGVDEVTIEDIDVISIAG